MPLRPRRRHAGARLPSRRAHTIGALLACRAAAPGARPLVPRRRLRHPALNFARAPRPLATQHSHRWRACDEHLRAASVVLHDGVSSRHCQKCIKYHPVADFKARAIPRAAPPRASRFRVRRSDGSWLARAGAAAHVPGAAGDPQRAAAPRVRAGGGGGTAAAPAATTASAAHHPPHHFALPPLLPPPAGLFSHASLPPGAYTQLQHAALHGGPHGYATQLQLARLFNASAGGGGDPGASGSAFPLAGGAGMQQPLPTASAILMRHALPPPPAMSASPLTALLFPPAAGLTSSLTQPAAAAGGQQHAPAAPAGEASVQQAAQQQQQAFLGSSDDLLRACLAGALQQMQQFSAAAAAVQPPGGGFGAVGPSQQQQQLQALRDIHALSFAIPPPPPPPPPPPA
jgi:hypothetical protein